MFFSVINNTIGNVEETQTIHPNTQHPQMPINPGILLKINYDEKNILLSVAMWERR